jgi:hypothetical protein
MRKMKNPDKFASSANNWWIELQQKNVRLQKILLFRFTKAANFPIAEHKKNTFTQKNHTFTHLSPAFTHLSTFCLFAAVSLYKFFKSL